MKMTILPEILIPQLYLAKGQFEYLLIFYLKSYNVGQSFSKKVQLPKSFCSNVNGEILFREEKYQYNCIVAKMNKH
jgi:hypothetical protein